MTDTKDDVHEALQNLPRFAGRDPDSYERTRLGGLTNLVYRIAAPDETLIVRIPGAGTADYIDRAVELHNARAAADAGVSAQVIWGDGKRGVMISQCLDPITTMTPELFKSRAGSALRAGRALARLHGSGETFQFRFELFAMISEYLDILATRDTDLPEGYHDIVAAAEPVKRVLGENPAALAPCHCDPLCENFLDDGNRMWIVDWEYSGMNDPMWDLGDLSVEAGFDQSQDSALLRAYFGREPETSEVGRMVIYKAMCDLLWTLWGLIQHSDGNVAEDFWAYSLARFERCKALMQNPEFAGHLKAIG